VKEGRLAVLGVTQEQHADRCRLFAQWQQLDWPILHDPINVLGSLAVPILVAIDEHGIARQVGPRLETFQSQFLDKVFPDDAPKETAAVAPPFPAGGPPPDFAALRRHAEAAGSASAWRRVGDALALWGGGSRTDEAIDAYTKALQAEPKDGPTLFRLGVCQRRRYESERRRSADFQAAVASWGQALALNPNQYIWRRRIQQYGPRLDKPYAFYDWIEQARKEIAARGDTPVPLAVEPVGAEIAHPVREFLVEAGDSRPPDPDGKIHRDQKDLIRTEVTVVPARVRNGQAVRVHVTFRPDEQRRAHWYNDGEPLRLWVDVPEGWQVARRLLAAPPGNRPETNEVRSLDFELIAPAGARGKVRLEAYALYNVCEDVGGQCLFLRKDIPIEVHVDP
jgi:hypothetical protein